MKSTPSEPAGDLRAVLLLWSRLSALLGTATTSALLRRALAQLSPRGPALAAVHVAREGLNFVCRLENPLPGDHAAELAALGSSLSAILLELTGPVVLRYLAGFAELDVFGFVEESQ
jgi:hypothetical protein